MTPRFPQVKVTISDLINETEPWPLINRCVRAAKHAGVSSCDQMRFTNHAVHFCRTYDEILLLAGDWWSCD